MMLGTPLQLTLLLSMAILFTAAGVLVCVATAMMVVGVVQRIRAAGIRPVATTPTDVARQRRIRRILLIAAALTAASFLLSALGQFI